MTITLILSPDFDSQVFCCLLLLSWFNLILKTKIYISNFILLIYSFPILGSNLEHGRQIFYHWDTSPAPNQIILKASLNQCLLHITSFFHIDLLSSYKRNVYLSTFYVLLFILTSWITMHVTKTIFQWFSLLWLFYHCVLYWKSFMDNFPFHLTST